MNGCLRAAFVLVGVFALIGFGVFKLFQSFTSSIEDFPEYARRDVVYAHYGSLIDEIQAAIKASESMHDLAARLEKTPMPDELLYLTLTKETSDVFEKEKLEVVERSDVQSTSYTLINDTGHGKLNDLPVIVIKLPVNRHSIEDCFIYLRHESPQDQDQNQDPVQALTPDPVQAGTAFPGESRLASGFIWHAETVRTYS